MLQAILIAFGRSVCSYSRRRTLRVRQQFLTKASDPFGGQLELLLAQLATPALHEPMIDPRDLAAVYPVAPVALVLVAAARRRVAVTLTFAGAVLVALLVAAAAVHVCAALVVAEEQQPPVVSSLLVGLVPVSLVLGEPAPALSVAKQMVCPWKRVRIVQPSMAVGVADELHSVQAGAHDYYILLYYPVVAGGGDRWVGPREWHIGPHPHVPDSRCWHQKAGSNHQHQQVHTVLLMVAAAPLCVRFVHDAAPEH